MADYTLVPVDHDPFADDAAAMTPETYVNPLVHALVGEATRLAMIPGQVYQNPQPTTTAERAAWRAQNEADDAERARTFAARRAAADTPVARRAEAQRQKEIAEDDARMRLHDQNDQ